MKLLSYRLILGILLTLSFKTVPKIHIGLSLTMK